MFCSLAVSQFLGEVDFFNLSATYASYFGGRAPVQNEAPQAVTEGAIALPQPTQISKARILWQRWTQTELHLGIMARGVSQIVLNHRPKLRIPLLSTVLPDEDTEALRLAHVAVRALTGQGAKHLAAIVHEFKAGRVGRCQITTRNITTLGDNAVPALEEEITLHKNDATLCARNIEALETIGSRNAWAALQSLLDSTDGDVAFAVASYFVCDKPENENHSAPAGFYNKVREIYYRDFYNQLISEITNEATISPEILNAFIKPQTNETLARTQIVMLVQVARCKLVPLPVRVRALQLLFESSYLEYPILFAATQRDAVIRLACLCWLSNNIDYRRVVGINNDPDLINPIVGEDYHGFVERGEVVRVTTFPGHYLTANIRSMTAWEHRGLKNRAVLDLAEAIQFGYSFAYNSAISVAEYTNFVFDD